MSSYCEEDALTNFMEMKEREVEELEVKLKQVKDNEIMLQRQKKQLQAIRAGLEGIFKHKDERIRSCREGLSQMEKNIFDQIYPIVEDIHHQEQLILELTEQLKLAQISRDVDAICSNISQASSIHVENPSDPLWCWYKEMKHYENCFKQNSLFNFVDGTIPDCHFFYPQVKDSHPDGIVRLSFSTRHKNTCIHVAISHDSNLCPEESSMPYKVKTDFAVDSLDVNINRSLIAGASAIQSVKRYIWPFIDGPR